MNLIYSFIANVKFTIPFKLISVVMIVLILIISGCGGGGSSSSTSTDPDTEVIEETYPEIFEESNKPFFEQNIPEAEPSAEDAVEVGWWLLKPWNYEKPANADREYPLVIYLHGSSAYGHHESLSFIGYHNDDYKQEYPSFVFAPQTDVRGSEGAWNTGTLIKQIESLREQYRIDSFRIYLIGYSMGAYSAIPLANEYDTYNGTYFAGFISLTGLRDMSTHDTIKDNTSIWIHMGLQERSYVVDGTRSRYEELKEYYQGEVETSNDVSITNYSGEHTGTTLTLTLDGIEVLKKTEYPDDGHGTGNFPFNDPYLIEWLFSQDLDNR